MASIWPSGDITDGQTEVRIIMVVTSVHETDVEKTASKSSAVSAQEGGMLYWPSLGAPFSQGSALFYQSGKLGRALLTGTSLDQLAGTERGLTHFSSACFLPV
jgi:hypothetical protein